jgi:membrane protease YdiL (CAAX protease family)
VNRRWVLTLSFAAIAVSWSRTFWGAFAPSVAPPPDFATLVLTIAVIKSVVAAVILALLWAGGESLRTLGFVSPRWISAIGRGIAYGVVVFVVLNVALPTALAAVLRLPGSENAGSLTEFFRDPANLLAWIPIGIIGGGVVEEIERAFILTRFELWMGKNGLYIGLLLSSIMFGVAHLYQSTGTGISAAVSGLALGVIYLRRRSGIEAAAAHAFADVLGVIAATLLAK